MPRSHEWSVERLDRDRNADIANDPPSLTYDTAASQRHEETGDSSSQLISAHDAWSRLVRVEYPTRVRGEYEYNGLNWRIIKRADTDLNSVFDQQRIMNYPRQSKLSRLSKNGIHTALHSLLFAVAPHSGQTSCSVPRKS